MYNLSMDDKYFNFVTPKELDLLRAGAKKTRYAVRNELVILMMYRHGLRESELCDILLTDLILEEAKIYIRRKKNGNNLMHPIEGDEMRLLRRYLRERGSLKAPWLFISNQDTQMHRNTVINIVKTSAVKSEMRHISPHMLRHGCGYYLVNKKVPLRTIQDYLGHKDIKNTVIYTRLSEKQFQGLFT